MTIDWDGISEKATSFAEVAAPGILSDIERALALWYAEHTTLHGPLGEGYLVELRRVSIRAVAYKLLGAADPVEEGE